MPGMQVPTVSLGLPVFNGEAFLARALDCVLAQTWTDFELVVSDNASTDATATIISDYAARDARIRGFRQPRNIGSGNNWTFVARQARGRYFKWVAADDEFEPRLLLDCVDVMERHPAVVLCYGRTRFIDLAGGRLDVYRGDFEVQADDPIERYRVVRERLHLGTPIQAGVIRTAALRRCGYLGNYPDSDRVLIAGLALEGKFVLLPRVLFYRRWDRSVASALRSPLELAQLYRPGTTAALRFASLPRQLGQLRVALMTPHHWGAKLAALYAAVRYTDWRRKLGVVGRRASGVGRTSCGG